MQETNFTALLVDALKSPFEPKPVTKKKMEALAVKNEKDLSEKKLPDYLRTPTGDELIAMRQWAVDYKKARKGASKREIRKATQEHFHIRIFR